MENMNASQTWYLKAFSYFNIEGLEGRKCLFNDILNTFYLWLYGVRHMVKDQIDSEKGNTLLPQGFFYKQHSTDRIAHTTVFVAPVMDHWLEQEIYQWVKALT